MRRRTGIDTEIFTRIKMIMKKYKDDDDGNRGNGSFIPYGLCFLGGCFHFDVYVMCDMRACNVLKKKKKNRSLLHSKSKTGLKHKIEMLTLLVPEYKTVLL